MSTRPRKHFDALVENLHHPDLDTAIQAAITLGRIGSYRAVPHLMQELMPKTRQVAIDEAAMQVKLSNFRVEVVRALVKVQIEGAIPTLTALLHDADDAVSKEAARLLDSLK